SAFGAPMKPNATETPPALLGFAVTSPILALSGGTRTVTVTLGLRAKGYEFDRLKAILADTFGKADNQGRSLFPLRFEVSTATGWIPCSLVSQRVDDYDTLLNLQNANSVWHGHTGAPGLRFVLNLPVGEVPVAPLGAKLDGMDVRWPALRILMQPVWSSKDFVTYYRELGSLFVGAVHIEVSVSGLLPSAIENDESVVDPKKPFEVFGSSPAPGSRLLIGHPEIVSKPIRRLSFAFQWFGAPANLATHYANYEIGAAPNFAVQVSTVDLAGTTAFVQSAPLFQSDTSALTKIEITPSTSPIVADYPTLAGTGPSSRLANWKRVWQWRLGPVDFQHRAYPVVAAKKSLEFVRASPTASLNDFQVKPPYTPKLQSLTIDYTAAVEIVLYPATAGEKFHRVYHVHPFGVVEIAAETESDEVPFLPRYDEDSELYIGFAGVSLPENVTLLVQIDEGSADRDLTPPQVSWSQLSGNLWKPLGNKVLADATRGLQKSGVIEFSLESAEPSTLLSGGLTWVRAAVGANHAAICDIRALHTQAAEVVFDDQGNAPTHYGAALPSGTITRLKSPISGIVALTQPYPSYGGRVAESETFFATRVSERLRHKQRALSSWDYERMVLDAFPEVFKAKCIPSSEEAPGLVEVLVIPDVRTVPTNEFGPKAPVALLGSIQQYLSARASRWVTVRARNANYRAVRVRLGVHFSEKGNQAYWMGRLNDELNRFLSPWAYDEGADVVVGGKIYASSIVEFVDRRAYVDYVAGISLFYTDDEGERFTFLRPPGDAGGAYCVEAGGPDRVLVAYPKHRIDLLTSAHYDARLYRGVNYMEMELDFVVG
ncbi:MAG TPA: baseplate J/gp47 family protein, partial [Polyangium sp.]|nr:baseplate J/gp47 family protein [Polyangium sp.]